MLRAAARVAAVAGLLFGGWLLAVWPPPRWYRTHWPAETAFMWMRGAGGQAGRRSSHLHPSSGRLYQPVPLDSISPFIGEPALIGEDNAFPTHNGIDWRSLRHAIGYPRERFDWFDSKDRKALWTVLPKAWQRREALRGASTITQQLAKNLYLSLSRNPLRKVKEAVTAYRLESALGKDRILEQYVNVVELGDGVWGGEAASQLYYRRSARNLSVDQAAAQAGSRPFPLRSNPGYRPSRMRWRQNLILRRLQGEAVEVPPDQEEVPVAPPAADSSAPAEAAPLVADTVLPAPDDSVRSTLESVQ